MAINIDFNRVADPIATSMGIGLNYSLAKRFNGESIEPGLGYTLHSEIAYSLNDKWVLTERLEYDRQPNIFMQNSFTMQTENVDQAYLTHSIVYNPTKTGNVYSLQLSLGLNDASTGLIVSVGVQR